MIEKNIPDIVAEVQLLTSEEGGLKKPMFREKVGCILTYRDEDFSCFLLIPSGAKVSPGSTAKLGIKFVAPELIKTTIRVGDLFDLRDYRVFAHGKVIEITSLQ